MEKGENENVQAISFQMWHVCDVFVWIRLGLDLRLHLLLRWKLMRIVPVSRSAKNDQNARVAKEIWSRRRWWWKHFQRNFIVWAISLFSSPCGYKRRFHSSLSNFSRWCVKMKNPSERYEKAIVHRVQRGKLSLIIKNIFNSALCYVTKEIFVGISLHNKENIHKKTNSMSHLLNSFSMAFSAFVCW